MNALRDDFFKYQAQTTPSPLAMEISHAEGSYIFDIHQKKYLDFVAGVSACSLGHRPPSVVAAVKEQLEKYWHVMVYGEYIQRPSVELTILLAANLPESLSCTYLTNSGTEAIEGAMKLAKRITGRSQFVAAKNAYHGSTQGAMSIMGFEERKSAYRPLLPGIEFITFNCDADLEKIDTQTAAVVLETIQGGAGFILPKNHYLKKVKKRCEEVGALLILDEIQPGLGRTGTLFGFETFGIVPDILVMGKGLGGGFPIGAFSTSPTLMKQLQTDPILGHITTFGGHPVIVSAALATLKRITEGGLMKETLQKEQLFRQLLIHDHIQEIRGIGLMLALILPNAETANQLVLRCMEKGLILFWLLFEKKAVRITPPLTLSENEIREGCKIILSVLDEL
jgi:acetylornithine/succinyldiaminopimelate/putrescine aminotransferase